ncbi:MAG: serine--tRNA ligase [Rhodospirillaceae bacterium TMED8]|nr:serine--tRNA ligase [Magnetovibrio sp.]OUT51913.1 MAG: serine--tRNA ligase [Rhodospirillaceae bacterium TMED8]|tara:strand:- start:885 stop:2168 length:1284 start_codon:yes stop_codon:yes gene_type:complete
MFDIKWIRENPEAFDLAIQRRPGQTAMSSQLIELDHKKRIAETLAQEIKTKRNALSKEIGVAKALGKDVAHIIAKVSESKNAQVSAEMEAITAKAELNNVLADLPNLPLEDVPDGVGEEDNVEIRKWGEPRAFDFVPKDHVDIGERLGMMDFETAAKLSGARFVMLKGGLAQMERALGNMMLNIHTRDNGYTEVNPPALVNDASMFGTGQLPKFGQDLFKVESGHWLIPTAEVPLTNIIAGHLVDAEQLPQRYTAMTWCFRSEAGAAGKDTRGMIRQHQFSKVELVSITTKDASSLELERMTRCAEDILERLEIPYRTIVLCAGDMGFGARKTYDIEAWLPSQGAYREISSCSVCGDFQGRRMNARYRSKKGIKESQFVHTLNGSALAVGRTLIAILENYQQADGSVAIPRELQHFMGGLEVLEPVQ